MPKVDWKKAQNVRVGQQEPLGPFGCAKCRKRFATREERARHRVEAHLTSGSDSKEFRRRFGAG